MKTKLGETFKEYIKQFISHYLLFLIFIKMDAEKCKIPKNNTKFVTLFLCVTDI